jgi:hypothetical protein
MVVNQEQGGEGGGGKVQCILISRAQEGAGRPAASAPVPASCPHGEKTTTPSTTTAGPLREQNGTPKAPVVQNGIPKSASVVQNGGTPKIPVVQNGTPKTYSSVANGNAKTSSTVSNGTAKVNDGGFVDVFKDVKFQCRPLTRTGGEEKKGMQEISLLQYDKMDRKERIKTGYSLGERGKGGRFSFCYYAIESCEQCRGFVIFLVRIRICTTDLRIRTHIQILLFPLMADEMPTKNK